MVRRLDKIFAECVVAVTFHLSYSSQNVLIFLFFGVFKEGGSFLTTDKKPWYNNPLKVTKPRSTFVAR